MNPKIGKLAREIEKTQARIADDQARLKEMVKQKTELENIEIITEFRSADVPIGEIHALLRAYAENGIRPDAQAPVWDRVRTDDTVGTDQDDWEDDTDE